MSDQEDPIEKAISRFGRYQTWILILLTVGRIPTEIQLTNVVFLLQPIDYICGDDLGQNVTNSCPCGNPIYDESDFTNTVITTWDLICDRRYLASLAQSMLQVGVLVGSILFGYISDRFGRKMAVLLSLLSEVFVVAISAAITSYWLFLIFRILIGTAIGGTMLCCYVYLIEMCGKSFRPYLVGLHEISYLLGYLLLPTIAYLLRDWRYIQLAGSLPWLFVLAYYWLIPESPRWLITMGRKKEAVLVLSSIAKRNKMPVDNIEKIVDEVEQQSKSENYKHGTYLDLFKTKTIAIYTIIIAFIWLFCAHTFFGSNQYIGRLDGNIFLNVIISAASHAPAIVICVLANLYLPRKFSMIIFLLFTAVSLILLIFVTDTTIRLVFAVIALLGMYTSMVTLYLYTLEVFPTVVRNSGIGLASVFGRFGGFIAPFVVDINVDWISLVIFSAVVFLAAAFCLFLPETKDKVLFNSIEQVEQLNQPVNKLQDI